MAEQEHSTDSASKNFFSTLPGIITAIAGLITALGGFILILNKTGCMSPKGSVSSEQHIAQDSADINDLKQNIDSSKIVKETNSKGSISYKPAEIKVILKNVLFKIETANIETLPNKDLILNLKVKCVNNSIYEYHFYAYNMSVKIGEDKYAADPLSPSEGYQSVAANSFKNLEYNYRLPAGTKTFNLVISDEKEEMGSSVFTVK